MITGVRSMHTNSPIEIDLRANGRDTAELGSAGSVAHVRRVGKSQQRRTQVERDTRVGDIVLASELGQYVLLLAPANSAE